MDILEATGLVKLDPLENAINGGSKEPTIKESGELDLESPRTSPSHSETPITNNEEVDQNDKEERDPFEVDFTGPEDIEHPVNWPTSKKTVVVLEIMILTAVTYMGSSIYTPGQEGIQKDLGVGHVVATLNLSMYVLGYGLGPIIFSPLSEFAIFGRQQLYIVTLFLFSMLQIGCALVGNIAGLVILRFFTGILCSPSISTGAATVGDIVHPQYVPVLIGLWSIGAVAAPATGPTLGAAMFVADDWRLIFWLLMWCSSLTLVILIFFFPETNRENIIYRRCRRLQKITGDKRHFTAKSREEAKLTMKDIAVMSLWRPFIIIIKEPIVLALDSYHAVAYGTFYLFFEAFPIVFVQIHHFTVMELGLSYLGFCVGSVIAFGVSVLFFTQYVPRRMKKGKFTPETILVLSMLVGWFGPLALFLFGWAASVHWILPLLSEIFYTLFLFNLFQAVFTYLAMSYPKYVASVIAGNGLFRAGFACAFPLFGQAMYDNLAIEGYPVGWGSSLVGFLTIGLAIIPFILHEAGPYLRSKSKFTG